MKAKHAEISLGAESRRRCHLTEKKKDGCGRGDGGRGRGRKGGGGSRWKGEMNSQTLRDKRMRSLRVQIQC